MPPAELYGFYVNTSLGGTTVKNAEVLSVTEGSTDLVIDGDGAGWVDDDGTMFWCGRIFTYFDEGTADVIPALGGTFMMRSESSYGTENSFGASVGRVFKYVGAAAITNQWIGDAIVMSINSTHTPFNNTNYIERFSGASQHGRQVLIHQAKTTSVLKYDDNIGALFLGGYTNVNLPQKILNSNENQRARWTLGYIPCFKPADVGWGEITAGAGNIAQTGGSIYTTVTGAPIDRAYITRNLETSPLNAYCEQVIFRVTINIILNDAVVPLGASYRVVQATMRNAAGESYDLIIRIAEDGYRIWDNHAGGFVSGLIPFNAGRALELLVGIKQSTSSTAGDVIVYSRTTAGAPAGDLMNLPDRKYEWDDIFSGTLQSGGAVGSSQLLCGHVLGGGNPGMSTDWSDIWIMLAESAPPHFWAGEQDYKDRWGRTYAQRGLSTYVSDGVSITALDGNARAQDVYKIETRYEYAKENMDWRHSKTPRVVWRSEPTDLPTDQVPAQHWVWEFNDIDQDIDLGNGMWFLRLTNVHGYRYRAGNTIKPRGGSATESRFYHENECIGWTIAFNPTAGGDTSVHRIVGNSSGYIYGGAATKVAVFFIEGGVMDPVISGDPGRATLRPSEFAWVWLTSDSLYYSALRLEMSAHQGYDQRAQIGNVTFGRVFIPGKQYSRGRMVAYEPNSPVEVSEDGVWTASQLGPGHRELKIAWTDGVDTTLVGSLGDATNGNFWNTSGSRNYALQDDVCHSLMGISEEIGTGVNPFVYFPQIDQEAFSGATASQMYVGRRGSMLMLATTGVQLESVVGNENENEVFRVASFSAKEVT